MKLSNPYNSAVSYAKSHYENFPVISFLVPRELQKHIAVIYWFARSADDLADEGDHSVEKRMHHLNVFEWRFKQLLNKEYSNDLEFALHQTIEDKDLSVKHFFDLIDAFKQDVNKHRYSTYDELLNYCSRSANPVGRLILELYNIRNDKAFYFSDKICTALQITNFLQDVEEDYNRGRIYIPQEDLKKFKVEEKVFEIKENNLNLNQVLRYNIDRTRELFKEGRELLKLLSGRLKLEIGWTIAGGEAILDKIEQNNYRVFGEKPKLKKSDFARLLLKSFVNK